MHDHLNVKYRDEFDYFNWICAGFTFFKEVQLLPLAHFRCKVYFPFV